MITVEIIAISNHRYIVTNVLLSLQVIQNETLDYDSQQHPNFP